MAGKLRILFFILLILILTVFTQVGGIILLACIPLFRWIRRKVLLKTVRNILNTLAFLSVYVLTSLLIIPPLARWTGRLPLPVSSSQTIKPLTVFTCLLNRHYVKPVLLTSLKQAAADLENDYPGTVIAYLDAGFPFVDGFPLFPHLSHNDGQKLDLAFLYIDNHTNEPVNHTAPSPIGYGVHVDPEKGEQDMAALCANRGFWQYGILERFVPQWNKDRYALDKDRTRKLILLFANDPSIGKIFIEPHLKTRLRLDHNKVRFHGCHAVRHDDHIHVQVK